MKLLQQFILASFDMARELQVVPKKIQYVARQEQQLYEVGYNRIFNVVKSTDLSVTCLALYSLVHHCPSPKGR